MVINADCIEHMNTMPPNSVDSIVTDPPYHLTSIVKRFGKEGSAPAQYGTDGVFARSSKGFMGKEWDGGDIAFRPEVWAAALRVAKPGAYLMAFGGTRTFHRMACAIEDAGWEIRDTVMWVYGSGFPKSHNVGKGIDKAAGAEREVVGLSVIHSRGAATSFPKRPGERTAEESGRIAPQTAERAMLTAPATDAAKQWDGWGTALKPAWEPIIMARKPLDGTVAQNVQTHGTGAINIDGCRVGSESVTINTWDDGAKPFGGGAGHAYSGRTVQGRWPANVIHDGSDEVLAGFPDTGKSTGGRIGKKVMSNVTNVPAGQYEAGDPGYGDSGSAARFFYCAKANKSDRDEGCEGMEETIAEAMTGRQTGSAGLLRVRDDGTIGENPYAGKSGKARNHHPTVKPTALMRYCCKMVTPPNGTVLDPFCGSGSTGKAAILEGFRFIGIEKDPEYFEIANARIEAALAVCHSELESEGAQLDMFK